MLYTHPIDAINDVAIFGDEPWEEDTCGSWEDGISDEEIEEGKREIERYQRQELAAGKAEYAQVCRDFKEKLLASGTDIVDYCHNNDIALHEADRIAAMAGYHGNTWSDQRNVTRRAKEATRRVSSSAIADRLQTATRRGDVVATAPNTPEPVAAIVEPKTPQTAIAQPDAKPLEPSRSALSALLPEAAKGCSYTRKAVLYELVAAKLEKRNPAPFVNRLSKSAREDINLRVDLVWRAAIQRTQEVLDFQQRIEEAREEAKRVLAPIARQVRAHHHALLQQHPHARIQLAKSWELFTILDMEQRIQNAHQHPIRCPESLLRAAIMRADAAVKYAERK